ncbi:hypothetical protein PSCICN_34150 [Pseudomonas cichorii]|uniref:alkaline phosphatase family protein n=1 Tax=Pseudomonas cichorii TaxID=36746 RepID=UPI001910C30D|nr:alkaline phosphatase family protein [Pseudomonas cichorii]GFM82723.1 hypothetical protein PSCICN_34150 [Pseudomonas cichorii]
MGTKQNATIFITNDTGGNADIVLFHTDSNDQRQSGQWSAQPGQTVGPLEVTFETGLDVIDVLDYWSVMVNVRDGESPGYYANTGTAANNYKKECQLQHQDAGKTTTLSVSTAKFNIKLNSGGCSDGMKKLAPAAPITHVFVVMLENHSFDNIFAMSGIPGITAATTNDSNTYKEDVYKVQASAPVSMPSDPGHEFTDVLEQLTGGTPFVKGQPYPTINNSGFASSYATSTTEYPKKAPPSEDIIDVMSCFDTRTQLPVIYNLATEFAICDHWHSSIPGPTWPNRFFVHGASSAGFDDSPKQDQMLTWETTDGFVYPNGSIFQRLKDANIQYRIYNDSQVQPKTYLSLYSDQPERGTPLGAIPQVAALKGLSVFDIESLQHFADDLQQPYPFSYTFIEPHYGSASTDYAGGSSQHPMDDVYGGEHLLQAVYAAIRNSPYWNTSLLIVTYDEHGGLYDSVAPGTITAPGDKFPAANNTHGFDFTTAGVRVPAIVASPLIPKGTVDSTLYDHASVPALLEKLWGLNPLTQRDATANTPLHLLSLTTPRDTPSALANPKPPVKETKAAKGATENAATLANPVPVSGNLAGTLAILRKMDAELSAGKPAGLFPEQNLAAVGLLAATSQTATVQTLGNAEQYAEQVLDKVHHAKALRGLAEADRS